MDYQELVMTVARVVVMYAAVLFIVRLLGKRTVGNFTAFDLIVTFLISDLLSGPIYGDVPLIQALVAIGMVAVLHYLNSWLGYHVPWFDALTGGKARPLIENGKMARDAMAAEHINENELIAMLREKGIDDLDDVARGTLETNGQLSVRTKEPARQVEKRDLEVLVQHTSQKSENLLSL